MSSIQRMINYHIARLRDKRPHIRLDAINELVLLNAFDAMDVLREVYENDSDVDVRKAAQAAGRTLFLKQTQQQASSE